MKILNSLNSVEDIKKLDIKNLNILSRELRQCIFNIVTENGGHLSSNFGTIELTLALLKVFDFKTDKIVWDVGHQSYTYKILTQGIEKFSTLRRFKGMCGFPKVNESEFDSFNTGHSSTSLSVGLGLARAKSINKQCHDIIAIIGDGSLTGGMAFEALNDLGDSRLPMIVVLNDNNMAISKNSGMLKRCLNSLRIRKSYYILKKNISKKIRRFPILGQKIYKILDNSKELLKRILIKDLIFNYFKLRYFGPIDGHNTQELIDFFEQAKGTDVPIVLHVITKKGKGLKEAELNPDKYHGIPSAEENLETYPSFSKTLGSTLSNMSEKNGKIVAVSAAMIDGTGLKSFQEQHFDRVYDVGICEQHAVTLCAGMAQGGLRPYCAIYSTFLQRAYDQIVHDVCLNNLPVVFCIDRAGVSGYDGATHNGLLDLSYLAPLPNIVIYAPKNTEDFKQALIWSESIDFPLALRYPKNCRLDLITDYKLQLGKWEKLVWNDSAKTTLLCVGDRMLNLAISASKLAETPINIVNACFIKPLDGELLTEISDHSIITMEDNIVQLGFNALISQYYNEQGVAKTIIPVGFNSCYIEHGTIEELYTENDLTPKRISEIIVRGKK